MNNTAVDIYSFGMVALEVIFNSRIQLIIIIIIILTIIVVIKRCLTWSLVATVTRTR